MIDTIRRCFISWIFSETARRWRRMRVEHVTNPHLVVDEMQPGATEVRHPVTVRAQMPADCSDHPRVRHDECWWSIDMGHEEMPCRVEHPIDHLVDRFEPGRTEIAFEIAGPFVSDLVGCHALPLTRMSLTPPGVDARLIEAEFTGDDRCGLGRTDER